VLVAYHIKDYNVCMQAHASLQILCCFNIWMQAAFSNVTGILEECLTAVHEHLLILSAVVTEIAEDPAGRRATVTASPASLPRATPPVLGQLKKSALTTPKDVINALGFPVETTPEDVSDILHSLPCSLCERVL